MNAIVTGLRPYVDMAGGTKIALDVIFYGTPLPSARQSTVQIVLAANDTANVLATKINAAVDAEAQAITAPASVTPATTFAPSYVKLR